MSDDRTSDVWSGFYPYVDYTRHPSAQSRWLLPSFDAKILMTALGIAIVTASGRLFRIGKRLCEKHIKGNMLPLEDRRSAATGREPTEPDDPLPLHTNNPSEAPGSLEASNQLPPDIDDPDGQPDPPDRSSIHSVTQGRPHFQKALAQMGLEEVWQSHNSPESLFWYFLLAIIDSTVPGRIFLGPEKAKWRFTKAHAMAIAFAVAHLGFFVAALVVGAALPAKIAGDSVALSTSSDCASYTLNYTDPESAYTGSRAYDFDALVDSAMLAQKCYKESALDDDCHYFKHRSIPYKVEQNATCPFPGGLCNAEADRAIHFSTPAIGAEVIGVNAPKTFEFRRLCTCSPLNMNGTFISARKEGNEYNFYYYYGRGTKTDYMFYTSSTTSLPRISGYDVKVLNSVPIFQWPYAWEPLPELRPEIGSMLTMIFIRSGKIYYLDPRNDPIFPADAPVHEPGIRETYYMNSVLHDTVLACKDRTEWRDPEKRDEGWRHLLEVPELSINDTSGVYGGFLLMRLSLANSHTYGSIRMRPESSLDAQAHLAQATALRLPENHWEIEAERLFKISLARIQIDARNIARGKLASYSGYIKQHTKESARICTHTYLFQSVGFTNINRTWFLVTAILCVFVMLMAVTRSDEHLWWESVPEWLQTFKNSRLRNAIVSFFTVAWWILQLLFDYVLRPIFASIWSFLVASGEKLARLLRDLPAGISRFSRSAWDGMTETLQELRSRGASSS